MDHFIAETERLNDLLISRQYFEKNNALQIMVKSINDLNSLKYTALLSHLDSSLIQHNFFAKCGIFMRLLLSVNNIEFPIIFKKVQKFLKSCDTDHIKEFPGIFAELCHVLTNELISRNYSKSGLITLEEAIKLLQYEKFSLTSVHSDLCKLALVSRNFSPALRLIKEIENVNSIVLDNFTEYTINIDYLLSYFYYGGMILTAIKDYTKALYFFEICLTLPALTISPIMYESFKKYCLVYLINKGQAPIENSFLPRYTSCIVNKNIRQITSMYNDLMNIFYFSKINELNNFSNKIANIVCFNEDENVGLVNLVYKAKEKNIIICLTKTFVTLKLRELVSKINLTSTLHCEKIVIGLIDNCEIQAKIMEKDSMIKFHSRSFENCNNSSHIKNRQKDLKNIINLKKNIKLMDEALKLNPSYILMAISGMTSNINSTKLNDIHH